MEPFFLLVVQLQHNSIDYQWLGSNTYTLNQSHNMEYSRALLIMITWLAFFPWVMGADMASSQIMVMKSWRSASEWHTFCI